MKPAPDHTLIADDPLDALLDLYASPVEGDAALAKWLTGLLQAERDAALKTGDEVVLARARARVAGGVWCRERICDALTKEAA